MNWTQQEVLAVQSEGAGMHGGHRIDGLSDVRAEPAPLCEPVRIIAGEPYLTGRILVDQMPIACGLLSGSAFRLLLEEDGSGQLRFKTDPVTLFEEKNAELSATIQNTLEHQGRVVHQVGKAADAWIRLEGQIQMEMLIRERIKAA